MAAPLSAGSSVAGFRLVRLLGAGGQSQVYLAQPDDLPPGDPRGLALKLVALPQADEGARQRFLRSAQRCQALPAHPHVVQVFGAGVEGDLGWLAMEAVPGGDLQRYTRPPRLLPEPVVVQLGRQLAQALTLAHHHGLVHRDLKPANVLVRWPGPQAKLVDFGLARSADTEPTATGLVPGTPAYMAPEQLAGGVPDVATDLYALGVLLFELLAGRRPHEAQTMGELLRQVAQGVATPLQALRPDLPAGLCELVGDLLAVRPERRPPDAGDVRRRLDGVSFPAV